MVIRNLQAKVQNWKEPKQVMPKSLDLRISIEIKLHVIWTLATGFPDYFNENVHIFPYSLQF